MKQCSKCKLEKEIEEFGINKLTKSGVFAACKECKRLEKKRYKEKNREKVLEDSRKYANKRYAENTERERKRHKEWLANNPEVAKVSNKKSAAKAFQKFKAERIKKAKEYREKNREKVREASRKYKAKNKERVFERHWEYWTKYPEKYKATRAVNNAIAQGKMTRPTQCSRCQKECKPEGHHPDYAKPLEVIWLCKSCHMKEHENDRM